MSKKRVYIAGHNGMVGGAIMRALEKKNDCIIITATKKDLNLLDKEDVELFFEKQNIDVVYFAAAKVGGIIANSTYPADFIYENLVMACNVIHAAHKNNVVQLLNLGSSCIYPKLAHQPISENELMQGSLEETNEPYAIAKIAAIKLCESYNRQYGRDYRSVMPTNLYGPNDNFHENNSHVIPGLIRRFHEAKINSAPIVTVWGSGNPKREFLYVTDMADACIYVMGLDKEIYDSATEPMLSHINIGTGKDCTIGEVALSIARVVGYQGDISFDASKPDGTPRKLLNVARLTSLGWKYNIELEAGLKETYNWFVCNIASVRT